MEENKKIKTWIVVLSCLLVLLGTYVFYLEYNKNVNTVEINEIKKSDTNADSTNNIEENNKETNLVIIKDEQNLKAEGKIYVYISSEESSLEAPLEISYIVNGDNKGKLEIKNNNKVVYTKNTEKNIIDIARLNDAYDSDIFLLYEDGTVGSISISNLQNNKYDIVKMENCKDIVRIQSIAFEHDNYGTDFVLVAVDNNGKFITLATYAV